MTTGDGIALAAFFMFCALPAGILFFVTLTVGLAHLKEQEEE